jgi:PAS domain S-box-containing protein
MSKIQNKIIVMFLLVTIVPIIIASVYFTLHITKFLKNDTITELHRNTENKVERTSHILSSIENDVNNLAVNVSLVNFIDAITEEDTECIIECKHNLELMLKGFSEKRGIYDKICYINYSGIETVRVNLLGKGNSTIVPFNELHNLRYRNYFKKALKLKKGKIYVSEPDIMRGGGGGNINSKNKPTLIYATPVFDRKQRKRGVLVFNVAASYLLENISGFNSIEGIESNLIDKSGNYLLNTYKSKRLRGTSDSNPLSNIKSALTEDVVNIVLSGNSGVKMVDNILLSFIPIKYDYLNSRKYWVYLETMDSSIVYSKIYTIYKIMGALVFLLITGVVVITIIFSNKITQPLKELVKGAAAVAKGDLDYYIDSESNDELKFVIFSFNKMVSSLGKARKQLQNYAHNLEKKVTDKTMIINEKLKKSEVLVEAGRLLCEQKDMNKSIDFIANLITKTLNINFCAILLLDKTNNSLLMVNGIGWKEGVVGNETINVGLDPQMSCNLEELKPVVIKDLNNESYVSTSHLLIEHGIVSGVSVPMAVGEHIIGVLGVYSNRFKEFSSDDTNFLQSVGHIVASEIESRRADKEIDSNNEYTNRLIETAQDAIVRMDNNGFINIWNKSAEKIFGYSENEIIGQPITKIIPNRDKKQHEDKFMRFLKTGEFTDVGRTIEIHGINKKGVEVPIEVSLTVQEIEKEKALYTASIRDLTESKRMEESFDHKN